VADQQKTKGKRRVRDYRREYARRIERGITKGLSRSQARGHANAASSNTAPIFKPVHRGDALDRAVQNMSRNGVSLTRAAKAERVSPERLRRFLKENTETSYADRKWTIVDRRAVAIRIATKGRLRTIRVERHHAEAVSAHWLAINSFLNTRSASHLHPFDEPGVRDIYGVFHSFETRPNVLLQLEAKDELSFQELYDDTATVGL